MHTIRLRGARTHNLRGIDLDFPAGQLVAVTGPSGSGKSSLAIDTLYSEGQRRFVESFSPYARQFLERLERPPIGSLEPVAAGVAVDRRAPIKSSRSTVATMADLEPYLSALFLREAIPVCPRCDVPAERVDAAVAARRVAERFEATSVVVTYSVPVAGTEGFLDVRERLAGAGYRRLWVGGQARDLDEVRPSEVLGSGKRGRAEVVVDRVRAASDELRRIGAALEEAWGAGDSRARVFSPRAEGESLTLAPGMACARCADVFAPPRAGLFSYQSPIGACAGCHGFGRTIGVDWGKVVPDARKSLSAGALRPWSGKSTRMERRLLAKFCAKRGIPFDLPWSELSDEQRALVFDGEGSWSGGKYPGVRAWFAWLEGRTYKMHVRVLLARYRSYDPCAACGGKRLSPRALGYRVGGLDLAAWHALELSDARARLDALVTATGQGALARQQLRERLAYLERVGLGYLTLDRPARTLSGGEAQRVSLTSALGTSLTGALFVLDEPTVGLHPTDVPPLCAAMRDLARRPNVVVVVEHEPIVVAACDRLVELGPGAGRDGGAIVFDGAPGEFDRWRQAQAAPAPAPACRVSLPPAATGRGAITIVGARANNLRDVTVCIPLGAVVAVTGPSGSGKSTLVEEVLYRALARARGYRDVDPPGAHQRIEGTAGIRNVTLVDQAPLGRTSRGNPATYCGAWNRIRALFAATPDAAARKLEAGHFSFNVAAGRCEACAGEGAETIEMQFLADVSLSCPSCHGRRFKNEVLQVRLDGRNVAEVLDLSVDEALGAFGRQAAVVRALAPLARLGLGYLPLGQPLSTLSGGEAQRLKLARALSDPCDGALLLLDEPSAGLHPREVAHLVGALYDLVRAGASVVVVEHDLDIVRAAHHVVDLGPGAGRRGGWVVATGTPAQVAAGASATGLALRGLPSAPLEVASSQAAGESAECIGVVRAREHNLKEVSVSIPHGEIVVVTGPSGSGKSTLAFDVVFAEGQRRFLETLTPYARQFLPMLPRPDVDQVTGVPPSIALEQRTSRAGAGSTVATVTEIAHYLRLLFAKVGVLHCPRCDCAIAVRTADAIFDLLAAGSAGRRSRGASAVTLLAPVVSGRKGTHLDIFASAAQAGIQQAVVDGALCATDEPPRLDRRREHAIDLVAYEGPLAKLDRECFDRAISLGRGTVKLRAGADERLLSTARSCSRCGVAVPELDPRWFSFNTKQGRCATCEGAGVVGADSDGSDAAPCDACGGSRLAPVPRAVRLAGERYHEICARSVAAAARWARGLSFEGDAAIVAAAPLSELSRRLELAEEVGLGYLALERRAATLSGGEMQRLRLAAQIGAGLTGALYVLDEPTIGLHPRDTRRLLTNLRRLADTGSTVLMVEHDADTIRAADRLIDLGPGGGCHGGHVVAVGTPADVLARSDSPTAQALSRELAIASRRVAAATRPDAHIELSGARAHNLRIERARFPLGRLTVVAGVSGSGKSTLVRQVLYPAARRILKLEAEEPGLHDGLRLPPSLVRALAVDQSPIGRTPRSVPATFLGIWDEVRRLFASAPTAAIRGYGPTRFSFNSKGGGRCPACEGQGVIAHEMSFLPNVTTVCDACDGKRFEPATLDVRWLGHDVGGVLALGAEEAATLFAAHPKIHAPLATMCDLGLGYLKIGQGSHTLSGGEAQRLKLAAELGAGARHRPTLFVLDEPTTGLHLADVARLIDVLDRLVARGDTLVVIEHHPAVIACADHVIELGPEGGAAGGRIVAEGSPREIARAATATGRVLAELFGTRQVGAARRPRRPDLGSDLRSS